MKFEPENLIERSETKMTPLSELKLDPENVRLKHLKKALSDEEIEKYLLGQKETTGLLDQIRSAKGLYQDLIITQNGIVKEGNRRLVCLRKLQKQAHDGELQGLSPSLFDQVKCTVLPTDATDEEISMLLSIIHVRGKKAWESFNKAYMLVHLHHDLGNSYDKLKEQLGISKSTLIGLIKAHDVTIQYSEKYPKDASWYDNFAIFEELFRRRALKDWRRNEANLMDFFSWVHENKIINHKQVRSLEKILDNKTARKIFDEESFDKAMDFLNSVDPTIEDTNFRKISNTIKTLRSFERKDIIKIINDPTRIKMLQGLRNEVSSLLRDIDILKKASRKKESENLE